MLLPAFYLGENKVVTAKYAEISTVYYVRVTGTTKKHDLEERETAVSFLLYLFW